MFEGQEGASAVRPDREASDDGEDWLEALDTYDVRYLVLDRRDDAVLLRQFGRRPGWTVDFEDQEAVVFARLVASGRDG